MRRRRGGGARPPLETRAQHPGARALIAGPAVRAIGIDLGTTNTALAWAGPRGAISIYDIPQLVAANETARLPTLPSFLYRADDESADFVAGVFAREEGALAPARQIASAKSWLANPRVDRTAPLLPWGSETGPKLSPVHASARLLAHLRDAWNQDHVSAGDEARLERQPLVLTVPASFDEEARELTVDAARAAGLESFTLLEEPLAALYAWISAHRRNLTSALGSGGLMLVCDVGGGTTDFTLVRARQEEGELTFERTAIGEHLLLGGDNLDLALAALAERRMGGARLTLIQRQILRRKCSEAKERLLSDPSVDRVPITILGAGRGVVGGGLSTELTFAEVRDTLENGFLPVVAGHDLPARDRRVGLRELGLPYEAEPAITKHLAAFLTRAGRAEGGAMARPDLVLFNGGFFTPARARTRVLEVLESWLGSPPAVLENPRPEAAVAIGAAFYGRLRRDVSGRRPLLIRAGSAHTYYVGVEARGEHGPADAAICVIPRGTNEGTHFELDREFTVMTNRPAAFTLHSSRFRSDPVNALVALSGIDDITRHAPLVTALRYGKRSRTVPLAVRLAAEYTETGTLELWCESIATEHRWRLAFNLRGLAGDGGDDDEPPAGEADTSAIIISEDALAAAASRLRDIFGPQEASITPAAAIGELENVLGHGKLAWPLGVLRPLADVLLQVEAGRTKSAAHEVRWLNLTGFCMRPGFGSALDEWRVSELRKVYAAGLAFPREIQNQVEWLVLWGRVGAGFTAGQQRELAQRVAGQLGIGSRKAARLNPQVEREAWRLLASLERLDSGLRTKFADELVQRIRRDPRNAALLWALGRIAARAPLYGPLNAVVPAAQAEALIAQLSGRKDLTADAAAAVACIGARTGDPARDVSDDAARTAAGRLAASGFDELARRLRDVVPVDLHDASRVFGEALPEGLRLGAASDR